MKHLYFFTLLLLFATFESNGQWSILANSITDAGKSISYDLALDSNNNPYIAYRDFLNTGKITVLKYSGGTWTNYGNAGFSNGATESQSLAFDNNDVLYAAFQDWGNSGKTTVMKYDGTNWVNVGNAGFSPNGTNQSIAISSTGEPYVLFFESLSNKVSIMKFNGTSWTQVGSSIFSARIYGRSLALDSNDVPYIVYKNSSPGHTDVKKFDGSSWVSVGSIATVPYSTEYHSIAIDSNNDPYICYTENGLVVKKFNGTIWETLGVNVQSGSTNYPSLALDSNDKPFVAFQSYTNSITYTSVKKFNGTAWEVVGGSNFSEQNSSKLSLALDTADTPYVSHGFFSSSDQRVSVMKFNQPPHIIKGKLTYDINNDNCATSTYHPTNIPIKCTATNSGNVYFTNPDINGDYTFEINEPGLVTTEVSHSLISSNPNNHTNTFSSSPQTVVNQDFCVTSANTGDDLGVVITSTSDARPGFDSSYSIIYTNYGNSFLPINGSINLNFDNSLVNYLSSLPSENSSTSNSLSWSFTNFQPFETRIIEVNFNINTPPTVNNGDNLVFTTSINPQSGDININNNSSTLNQTTIGSYDPNDYAILEGPYISPAQATDYLYFRIRFQNTGTASAININVETVLDTDIDWNTFQPIHSSHSYNTVINNGNEISFKFNNIYLADSTSDETNSHGYIVFKAKPTTSFSVGDIIELKADIYFDFNTAIITNTATTQIDNSLSNIENQVANNFNIYPNPTNGILLINLKDSAGYSLFNLNGQLVKKGSFSMGENHLDISNLSNGLYLIKTTTSEGKTFANKVYKK